eukprot:9041359-Pyramimonas_sp.AAC.1
MEVGRQGIRRGREEEEEGRGSRRKDREPETVTDPPPSRLALGGAPASPATSRRSWDSGGGRPLLPHFPNSQHYILTVLF